MRCKSYDPWGVWLIRQILATLMFVGAFASYMTLSENPAEKTYTKVTAHKADGETGIVYSWETNDVPDAVSSHVQGGEQGDDQ